MATRLDRETTLRTAAARLPDRAGGRRAPAIVLAAAAVAGGCAAPPPPADVPKAMLVVPWGEARFAPVAPSLPDGPQIAVLSGDPDRGPSHVLLRMPRGAGPLHTHTADYHLIVLEGEMKHRARGEREADAPVLRAGSYWFQPGGEAHADSCLTETCVMFVAFAGPRDGTLLEDMTIERR